MGERDLWTNSTNGINHDLLLRGLYYTTVGITLFFLGAVIGRKEENKKTNAVYYSSEHVIIAYRNIGKIIILLCVPAFIAIVVQDIGAVSANGYLAYYDVSKSRCRILSTMPSYFAYCI